MNTKCTLQIILIHAYLLVIINAECLIKLISLKGFIAKYLKLQNHNMHGI